MIEPNARRRLQLIAATSHDPQLVKDLRQVLEEDPTMSFVPSAELLRQIALCAECTQGNQDGSRSRDFATITVRDGTSKPAWPIRATRAKTHR
jgi:hypothetical protein